jgi:hypothetical protein
MTPKQKMLIRQMNLSKSKRWENKSNLKGAVYTISLLLFATFTLSKANAQFNSTSVPKNPDVNRVYLFYLHGGVVQDQGVNAVSEYYGKYEYQAILDTLKNHGFYVVSEVRARDTKEREYAKKIKSQIDTLIERGVSDKNIIVVGASLGAYIALETSILNRNPNIRFVLLGLCSEYALKYFQPFQKYFTGQFLSIYESSDSKGTCLSIFQRLGGTSNFKEIKLEMGIDHAFLFKPFDDWVNPLINWINNN